MRRILLRRPKFWRSENMAKIRENRRISCVMKKSCKVAIVKDEFLTSIDHNNQLHLSLLFNHSIYRPMCTQMG